MADYFMLTCPSCGAILERQQNHGKFVCAYCGRVYILSSEQKVIALKPQEDDLKNIEAAVDETEVDFTLRQINFDIYQLNARKNKILEQNPNPKSFPNITLFVGALFILYYVLISYKSNSSLSSCSSLAFTIGVLILLVGIKDDKKHKKYENKWQTHVYPEIKEIDELIEAKRVEMKQLKNNEE